MKLSLTKVEYRDLLDLIYIADWVLHAHRTQDEPRTVNYQKLEQKLLSFAEEAGFSHLIEYAPKFDRYFPTRMFEDVSQVHGFIDEYDNDSFWEELANRLAERDLIKQEGGLSNVLKLSIEERLGKQFKLEERYATEFEENGLDNITIV